MQSDDFINSYITRYDNINPSSHDNYLVDYMDPINTDSKKQSSNQLNFSDNINVNKYFDINTNSFDNNNNKIPFSNNFIISHSLKSSILSNHNDTKIPNTNNVTNNEFIHNVHLNNSFDNDSISNIIATTATNNVNFLVATPINISTPNGFNQHNIHTSTNHEVNNAISNDLPNNNKMLNRNNKNSKEMSPYLVNTQSNKPLVKLFEHQPTTPANKINDNKLAIKKENIDGSLNPFQLSLITPPNSVRNNSITNISSTSNLDFNNPFDIKRAYFKYLLDEQKKTKLSHDPSINITLSNDIDCRNSDTCNDDNDDKNYLYVDTGNLINQVDNPLPSPSEDYLNVKRFKNLTFSDKDYFNMSPTTEFSSLSSENIELDGYLPLSYPTPLEESIPFMHPNSPTYSSKSSINSCNGFYTTLNSNNYSNMMNPKTINPMQINPFGQYNNYNCNDRNFSDVDSNVSNDQNLSNINRFENSPFLSPVSQTVNFVPPPPCTPFQIKDDYEEYNDNNYEYQVEDAHSPSNYKKNKSKSSRKRNGNKISPLDSLNSDQIAEIKAAINTSSNVAAQFITKEKSATNKNKKTAIPRPMNKFLIYRKEKHDEIVKSNPNLCNNDISKIIGAQWKNEPQAVKDKYFQLAEEAKLLHMIEYPDYKFKPRKIKPKRKKRKY